MNWRQFTPTNSFSANLPSFEELRQSVDYGVKAAGASVKDVASSVKDLSMNFRRNDNLHGITTQNQEEKENVLFSQHAKDFFVMSSKEVLNKVSGVFDLDSLRQAKPENIKRRKFDHYLEQDVTYITDRVLVMGYPDVQNGVRTIDSVATLLNELHGSAYTVWNLSEKKYSDSCFLGQVMDVSFRGYPAPPLSLIVRLCISMESWMNANLDNVVVVHCLTGRGRSTTMTACLLEWIGECSNASDALSYICRKRNAPIKRALLPTQIRYVQMFHEILNGKKLHHHPLILEKLVLYFMPNIESSHGKEDKEKNQSAPKGCNPYLQVYKDGVCIFSESKSREAMGGEVEGNKPILFSNCPADSKKQFVLSMGCMVQGDIVLNVDHIDKETDTTSNMFRYGFHTGYIRPGVLELTRRNLDGGNIDPRFSEKVSVQLFISKGLSNMDNKSSDCSDKFDEASSSFWAAIAKQRAILLKRRLSETQDAVVNPIKTIPNTASVQKKVFSLFDDEDEGENLGVKLISNNNDIDKDGDMKDHDNNASDLHHLLNALDDNDSDANQEETQSEQDRENSQPIDKKTASIDVMDDIVHGSASPGCDFDDCSVKEPVDNLTSSDSSEIDLLIGSMDNIEMSRKSFGDLEVLETEDILEEASKTVGDNDPKLSFGFTTCPDDGFDDPELAELDNYLKTM